ncbi:MAG: hypothetical protein ACJAVV_001473 [Alphaproteobacteria bacterium]
MPLCFTQKENIMKTLSTLFTRTLLLTSFAASAFLITTPAMAEGGSVNHSGQASKHAVLALGHGARSSAKVASAVVAAPIMVAGGLSLAAGSTALLLGDSLASSGQHVSAHTHTDGPLDITDMVITADPAPNQVIAQSQLPKQQTESEITTITTTEMHKAVKKTTVEQAKR